MTQRVNWVLDFDVQTFFDSLDHEWLVRMLEHRIADRRIIRLIRRWLKAGVLESGKWMAVETGSPQGSGISPLLANVFLHYVFDAWIHQWRRRHARGCSRRDYLAIGWRDSVATVIGGTAGPAQDGNALTGDVR
jgi:retron-type reverse transcriptase